MSIPVRRKVFRIEATTNGEPARSSRDRAGVPDVVPDVLAELTTLRELIENGIRESAVSALSRADAAELQELRQDTTRIQQAISQTRHEIATLYVNDVAGSSIVHVARELDAVVGGAEGSIQRILAAAEDIEQAAHTLSAAAKGEHDQSVAKEIKEDVVRILEACNFHDIAGQRISKVLVTLKFVEDRITRMMEIWRSIDVDAGKTVTPKPQGGEAALLNGPKLDGEPGHASQADIDAMFTEA